MGRMTNRRSGALVALIALLALMAVVPVAGAASSAARAAKPSYSASALRLAGVGGYAISAKSASVSVTVCLQKRSGGSFLNIRCKTKKEGDRSVKARVVVPGCVAGVWRTSVFGFAGTNAGGIKLPATALSPIYRCSGAKTHRLP